MPETLSVRPMVTIPVSLINAIGITLVFCIFLTNLTVVLNFWIRMYHLFPETQKQLKKISSTHLAAKLGKTEFDPDRLEQLEQADLLEVMAETILAKPTAESETDLFREARKTSQIPLPVGKFGSAASDGGSAAVRLRELELEKKRAERKREERQVEKKERKAPRG